MSLQTHRLPAMGMGMGRPLGLLSPTCGCTQLDRYGLLTGTGTGPGMAKNTWGLPMQITSKAQANRILEDIDQW